MNYGWRLQTTYGKTTALHEIGHVIGLLHEHQNPNAGIVWNEQAVIDNLSGPPNNWDKDAIEHNVLYKYQQSELQASTTFDANSIMEYEFGPGLILQPVQYSNGLTPIGTISDLDKQLVSSLYPLQTASTLNENDRVTVNEAKDIVSIIKPPTTANYSIKVNGEGIGALLLYQKSGGNEWKYLQGNVNNHDGRPSTDNINNIVSILLQDQEYKVVYHPFYVQGSVNLSYNKQ